MYRLKQYMKNKAKCLQKGKYKKFRMLIANLQNNELKQEIFF